MTGGYTASRRVVTRCPPPRISRRRETPLPSRCGHKRKFMRPFTGDLLICHEDQDIAEYPVLLATILVQVIGTARLSVLCRIRHVPARSLQSAPSRLSFSLSATAGPSFRGRYL